jgi:hypothetical protein
MSTLDRIDKKGIRDLLGKGWLTHDGMWFYNAYKELGIEKANKLNRQAIKSIAPIEVSRVKKALGFREKSNLSFKEIEDFMNSALEIILPNSVFKRLELSASQNNILHWQWEKGECFAYKGMKTMGIIDEYHCGVMYRIECWLEAMGIEFSINPKLKKCIMHQNGVCAGDISVIPAKS